MSSDKISFIMAITFLFGMLALLKHPDLHNSLINNASLSYKLPFFFLPFFFGTPGIRTLLLGQQFLSLFFLAFQYQGLVFSLLVPTAHREVQYSWRNSFVLLLYYCC